MSTFKSNIVIFDALHSSFPIEIFLDAAQFWQDFQLIYSTILGI